MITRSDETELLTALHEGIHEDPRWLSFITRLRRRSLADRAALLLRSGKAANWIEIFAEMRGGQVRKGQQQVPASIAPPLYSGLHGDRVYSHHDIFEPGEMAPSPDRGNRPPAPDRRFQRAIYVSDRQGGACAGLVLERQEADFTAANGALLRDLAPHLEIALRNLVALERERFRLSLANEALERAGIGWAMLDEGGRLLDSSSIAARVPGRHGRLPGVARGFGCVTAEAEPEQDGEPPLEFLTVPAPGRPLAAFARPAAVALVRRAPRPRVGQDRLLAKRFELSISEARLAVRLAQGLSIAEAADDLHLTIETARNYTKRVYAKTGTRGQVELVRLVLTSAALLA